eukprot:7485081-Alexandrium_andersonii.AAC.1
MSASLVGSEMCIRDSRHTVAQRRTRALRARHHSHSRADAALPRRARICTCTKPGLLDLRERDARPNIASATQCEEQPCPQLH